MSDDSDSDSGSDDDIISWISEYFDSDSDSDSADWTNEMFDPCIANQSVESPDDDVTGEDDEG